MMMTTTARLDAAAMIARHINADLNHRPHFTLTRNQLRNRIDAYLDCPHDAEDARRIFARLACDPAMPFRP